MGNLSAMVKLNLYLIDIQQINQGNLSTIIPRYVEDCEEMNDENKIMELTPEELVGTHLCLPERLIEGPDPSEWTNSMYIKTYGVPDKLSTVDEPYPVHGSPSNRQGEMVKEKPNSDNNKRKRIAQSEDSFDHLSHISTEEEQPEVIGDLDKVEKSQQRIEIMNYIRTESDHIEINSSVDNTHVSADEKLKTPNIEISDVTENLDDNLESLLEIKEKLSSNYMRIYELPAENEIAEDNNIEISMLLSGKDDHEVEVEMMKVLSNIVDKDNFFDSESLLEENNINEWFSETKSSLPTDTEDERGVELIADACKEIDNLIDTNDEVVNSNVKAKIKNEDTRVSEKFSKPDPETVKKGSIIRVLWTPKTTDSLYWIQGVVTKTIVSEVKIEKKIVKKNKVTIEKLSMIEYFGKEYCNDLPPKLQVESNIM